MKIGVFDSGVGGQSVANAIAKVYPNSDILVREDKQNLPYGTKTKQELFKLVKPILEQMANDGCKVIVVACNTVTTNIISELRAEISVPLVGIEPMIKPASKITKSKIISVFATPATLSSQRYEWLKEQFAEDVRVIEPDCSRWAQMVEYNNIDRNEIESKINFSLSERADVIVLGCTHYHWIQELIEELVAGKAKVLQPEDAVIAQLSRVLEQTD